MHTFIYFVLFFEMDSLCSPGRQGAPYVDQADLGLTIFSFSFECLDAGMTTVPRSQSVDLFCANSQSYVFCWETILGSRFLFLCVRE